MRLSSEGSSCLFEHLLGWPKHSLGFFCKMLPTNKLFGQLNTHPRCQTRCQQRAMVTTHGVLSGTRRIEQADGSREDCYVSGWVEHGVTWKHSVWGASQDRLRDSVGLGCLTSRSSHNETDPYSHPQLNRQQRPLAKKSKMGEGQGVGVPEAPGLKKLQLENAGSSPSPPWKKVDKIHPRLALCYLFLTRVLSAKNIQGDYRHHPWGSRGRLLLVLLQKVKVLSLSVLSDCHPGPELLCPWGFSRQEHWSG